MRSLLLVPVGAALALAFGGCSSGGGQPGAGGAGTTTDSATSTATATGAATGTSTGTGGGRPAAGEDWTRDILGTDLTLDVTTLKGTAKITLAPSTTSQAASFEIGDLDVASVEDAAGALEFAVKKGKLGGQLDVGVPGGTDPATITVAYTFKAHDNFDGWMPKSNVSFLWPYFCGNLFPCKSDPADGLKFTMAVSGVPAGLQAIFPATIPADAPSYMPGIAIADYTKLDLGTTAKGTKISAWYLPGQMADAQAGTAHLQKVFDFYEKTYGDYTFGKEAGSVSVDWGPGDFGGMEHHPYWHVGKSDFKNEETQAHEAAHGWYGDGVRIQCWEDFVLSEGTVSYLAAHALELLSVDVWPDYECELQYVCDPANMANTIALPTTCGAIDLLNDPLWSSVPYMKGAYFYREVAKVIGAGVLDEAIGEFYKANVGKAARMQALVDAIKVKGGAANAKAIDDLEKAWLQTVDCPVDYTKLCPAP